MGIYGALLLKVHPSTITPLIGLISRCARFWFGSATSFRNLGNLLQMLEDVPQITNGVQLSRVQGYMSKFYRRYGTWVAGNPVLVLCSSVAIALLLCLGLVRFRPEKLWVGPGSRATEEKQFFDSQLAPFYRFEQLIIATIPDSPHGKAPSIVTENNINLLFDIQKKADAIRALYSGTMVSLTDICMKPLGKDCATQSILQYFKIDSGNYDGFGGIDHVIEHISSSYYGASCFRTEICTIVNKDNTVLYYS